MSNSSKRQSDLDANQTLKSAYNDADTSFAVSGFLAGKVGRKVTLDIASEVETWTFLESGATLYVLTLTYTNSDRDTLVSAERTA